MNRSQWGLLSGTIIFASTVVVSATATSSRAPRAAKPKTSFDTKAAPFIKKYCVACHTGSTAPSGVDLAIFKDEAKMLKSRDTWERVARNVGNLHMPPKDFAQPSKAERAAFLEYVESTISGDCSLAEPGRVTARRLNRQEYNNSVKDLLGLDLKLANDFPSDEVGYGFDNIGDVLSISPLLMEKYVSAAETLAEAAIPIYEKVDEAYTADRMSLLGGAQLNSENRVFMYTESTAKPVVGSLQAGTYRVSVKAYGDLAGPELPKLAVNINSKRVAIFNIRSSNSETYEAELSFPGGETELSFSYLNNFNDKTLPPGQQDRNIYLSEVKIVGPINIKAGDVSASQRLVMRADPKTGDRATRTRAVLKDFATRAYRRVVRADELDRLMQISKLAEKSGDSYEKGVQLGVMAVLCSPNFLFRLELDSRMASGKERALNPYELAARMSYFIWSSTPDDELMRAAAAGELKTNEGIVKQTRRMLKSPKVVEMGNNFAAQWLQLRKLAIVTPDAQLFPDWTDQLRKDMKTETLQFFQNVVLNDRPITDFVVGKYTFINENLAKHYGLPNVSGPAFRKVSLDGTPRAGILTHGSVLTVTSNPTRTSPVKRGKYVLENIMASPPPPPPPGVGDLKDEEHQQLTGTVRQRMEQHRKDPTCASCHARMDPIGFGMENFDGIGKWRTKEGPFDLDVSGELSGKKFNGPTELRSLLMLQRDTFVHAFGEKMMTYALGRGMRIEDKCHLDLLASKIEAKNFAFSSVVENIVTSEPFRYRTVEKLSAPAKGAAPKPKTKKPPVKKVTKPSAKGARL